MAETAIKRQREETQMEKEEDESKRHKSYNHILSLLEADEDEPNQDLSSLITTLQQELSSNPLPQPAASESGSNNSTTAALDSRSSSPVLFKEEGGIIQLFEASVDELGIPHREFRVNEEEYDSNAAGIPLCDGFWEFEDETANYYTFLQLELFM